MRTVQECVGSLLEPLSQQQAGTQEKLNEIANLTSEVKSGWFDPQTGENSGGVLWMTSRLQQLASVSVA